MLDPALEEAIRTRAMNAPFARWMGMEFISVGEGTSELRLTLEPHHLNPGGIAHGGIIASLIDSSIGLALRTRLGFGPTHVTVQMDVHYVGAAGTGTITARGTAVHSGDRTGYGESSIYDENGRLLARGGATFLVVGEGAPPTGPQSPPPTGP